MCVCSAMTSDSKPRSSIAGASDTVSMLSSVTNVEIPNFICDPHLSGLANYRRPSGPGYSRGHRNDSIGATNEAFDDASRRHARISCELLHDCPKAFDD